MERQSLYTKRLAHEVARQARPSFAKKYHIVSSHKNRWAVVSEGKTRPLRSFSTQRSAIAYAKRTGINNDFGEVVIHSRDGMILNRIKI
jgi:hypothetical protein